MHKRKDDIQGIIKAFLYLLIVLVIAGTVVYLVHSLQKKQEPEITNTFVDSKLETVGELTAARLVYNGLIRYSDGDIPFLTKKAFTMTYRAEAEAGVDLSEAKTEVTETKVVVTLPEVEILSITVDENSIQYYDEKSALLNWETKEDALDAIEMAKTDVKENGDIEGLKENAKEQIKLLMQGLLADSIGERTLEFQFV